MTIESVSDTALWIAALRARESARADAVFDDPLAAVLAGERGRKIAQSIPRPAMVAWGVVARTSAIDRLIRDGIDAGVDTIVNLGAGLDTRPYRMQLPAHLTWIEVDFPGLLRDKEAKLADHRPVCKLERVGLDLLDRGARLELLKRIGATSTSALAITEGVISYLTNEDVAALAQDLRATESLRHWIQDFDNAGKRGLPVGWAKKLKAAPFLFDVKDWFEFFRANGWQSLRTITNVEEAARIDRPYPLDFPYGLIIHALPREVSQKILSLSGAVLLQR